MNRLPIPASIVLLVVFSCLNVTFAQEEKRTRTLHDAVIAGDFNEIKSMLSSGADINQKNRMGGTPLHTAIMNRQNVVAQLLITIGADVNAKDNSGQTPLSEAVKITDKEIIEQLIAKKVDINALTRGGDNALTLAKKSGNTEIVDLLVKNGAKEPTLQDIEGEMYGGTGYPGSQHEMHSQNPVAAAAAPAAQLDMLKDPNEIRTRVKTFAGLEKAVKDVNDKSQSETRQWEQTKIDNRTYLSRAVELQFQDEIALIRKTAIEENAKKTTAALDGLLSVRKKHSDAVYRGLMEQKRELKQTETAQPTRGRTRGRTTGRETTGRNSQAGPYGSDTAGPYDGMEPTPGRTRPGEQLDRETQEEVRQWTQAATDKKEELAKAVNQIITAEISSVRALAVEENAKKTTAAIDGLLLARQDRFDQYLRKAAEQQRLLQQQAQDPRFAERNTGRYTPGAGTQQQQPQQQRTRGRRR